MEAGIESGGSVQLAVRYIRDKVQRLSSACTQKAVCSPTLLFSPFTAVFPCVYNSGSFKLHVPEGYVSFTELTVTKMKDKAFFPSDKPP